MTAIGAGPTFESVDAVQRWAFENLLDRGFPVAPRGCPTRELLGQTFTLLHPRERIVRAPTRRWSLPLAIGEFCWHASASDDVAALAWYAPRWRDFSSDGKRVTGSCYGHKIFSKSHDGRSRWDALLAVLRDDPATRRAVIDLADDRIPDRGDPDVSCTATFQVFARGGCLHAMVHMRSNDVVWGLPYDVFLFTMIQEMLAQTLDLELGVYIHSAGSFHLYDRHIPLARKVLADCIPERAAMPVMEPLSGLDDFLAAEQALRRGGVPTLKLAPYWERLAGVLREFAATGRAQHATAAD
jgi:thymidylate synthase